MKPILWLLCLTLQSWAVIAEDIAIFACEPEWGALAETLAGDHGDVYTATTAQQDPHHIEARPSLIAKMRKADFVLCTGAQLEQGWLPLLIRSAGNNRIMPGTPGYLEAASLVERLDIPTKVDRSMGDVHSQGNPHVHLDPRRLMTIAETVTERLTTLAPDHSQAFQQNLQTFQQQMASMMEEVTPALKKLQGKTVIVYHNSWRYLLDWLEIHQLATIEAKPGIPPSTRDLQRLLMTVAEKPFSAVIIAAYQNDRPAQWLAEKADKPLVKLPYTVGGNSAAIDLPSLFRDTVAQLEGALTP